jgi:hypothetical protein
MGAMVVLAAAPLAVSARQLRAASLLAHGGGPARLARALRASPGDYRLHALMAGDHIRRGRCDLAVPHIRAARSLFPTAHAPRAMDAHCARQPGPSRPAQAPAPGAQRLF